MALKRARLVRQGTERSTAHYANMHPSVAFVGAGPTTIYTLHALVSRADAPYALTIFEEQSVAGRGTPYRPGWNDPAMLSNIASIELPPLEETLVEWLRRQPVDHLRTFGIDHRDIDDRAFYPRLALGEYFRDQFEAILDRARAKDVNVDVRTRCRVTDAVNRTDGIHLSIQPRRGEAFQARFDHVVMATGHQWPEEPEVRPGYFLSPWPASALARISPGHVGIRGTSLTAIDAAVAVAVEHGSFLEQGDDLRYRPNSDAEAFRLTMMSRKGLLPEADFFHPIPYEPLSICTKEAMQMLIEADADEKLLEKAYALFKQELAAADPGYAARIDLADLDMEEFCDRFFAERIAADPFDWAQRNLEEARRNFETETTVPWRYAILRMHEVIELIIPHLDDAEFACFSRFWKPVFVDDYATVPHESIERMLALHRAGKLDLIELGDDYTIDSHCAEGGATLHLGERHIHFPAFIEATGQRPLEAKDFPFPSLRKQGIVHDEPTADDTPPRGIAIDDQFHPVADDIPADRLFCLSLPFILGRHPFSQGITSSHEMGLVVGEQLAQALDRDVGTSPNQARPETETV
ncbi:FAD/NAD(P)-binding protein [Sphingomonas oryzagri]|uniref:FAD/NAD(P)-binding protein n=1 Tax=Sphingomonas oryzagri TaxID=3042314 RepID=A0ABT6MZF2_9SPHN|nr:FAD/NAD(P)-binding protein [Sphingomonas oryzagri]MDH7638177.1 FAD/NAD(P)-binding protein [Sphingomonas oryzagri]